MLQMFFYVANIIIRFCIGLIEWSMGKVFIEPPGASKPESKKLHFCLSGRISNLMSPSTVAPMSLLSLATCVLE